MISPHVFKYARLSIRDTILSLNLLVDILLSHLFFECGPEILQLDLPDPLPVLIRHPDLPLEYALLNLLLLLWLD